MVIVDIDLLKSAADIMQPIWIGGCGGLAALFVHKKRPPMYTFLAAFFVSGFSGFIMNKLCGASGINSDLSVVAVGMAGYFGPVVLNSIGKKVFSHLGLYSSEEEGHDKGTKNRRRSADISDVMNGRR